MNTDVYFIKKIFIKLIKMVTHFLIENKTYLLNIK